ncbi:MAG TPA: RDD family protein [Methylomirabilota bacterium]|nr:RDD family protein [Methylomirabilota bacterium]
MIGLEPPGLWRLWAAVLIDAVVGLMAWVLASMWLIIAAWGLRRSPLELEDALLLGLAVVLLALALHWSYHIAFVGGCGQTPGRMALGIVVVRKDGRPAGYGRATLRCVGGALNALTLGLLGLLVLVRRDRRGVGDVLAGTRVVRI